MHADVRRFANFAYRVFDVDEDDCKLAAEEGIRRYRAWLKELGMPTTFEELGAREEDIPRLVEQLGLNGNKLGSFLPLDDGDVANILHIACGKKG